MLITVLITNRNKNKHKRIKQVTVLLLMIAIKGLLVVTFVSRFFLELFFFTSSFLAPFAYIGTVPDKLCMPCHAADGFLLQLQTTIQQKLCRIVPGNSFRASFSSLRFRASCTLLANSEDTGHATRDICGVQSS